MKVYTYNDPEPSSPPPSSSPARMANRLVGDNYYCYHLCYQRLCRPLHSRYHRRRCCCGCCCCSVVCCFPSLQPPSIIGYSTVRISVCQEKSVCTFVGVLEWMMRCVMLYIRRCIRGEEDEREGLSYKPLGSVLIMLTIRVCPIIR